MPSALVLPWQRGMRGLAMSDTGNVYALLVGINEYECG